MKFNVKSNILCDNQHGFRKSRSCESQLITVADDLTKNIDNGFQTDMVVLDFAKAFDKVHHKSLLKKVKHYGIRNNIYNWLESFLLNRTQQVQIDDHLSAQCSQSEKKTHFKNVVNLLFLLSFCILDTKPSMLQKTVLIYLDLLPFYDMLNISS